MTAENPVTQVVTYYVELGEGNNPEELIEIVRPFAYECKPGVEIVVTFSRPITDEERWFVCRYKYSFFPKYRPVQIIVIEHGNNGFCINGYERKQQEGSFYEVF